MKTELEMARARQESCFQKWMGAKRRETVRKRWESYLKAVGVVEYLQKQEAKKRE